jgi:hypothetical protein
LLSPISFSCSSLYYSSTDLFYSTCSLLPSELDSLLLPLPTQIHTPTILNGSPVFLTLTIHTLCAHPKTVWIAAPAQTTTTKSGFLQCRRQTQSASFSSPRHARAGRSICLHNPAALSGAFFTLQRTWCYSVIPRDTPPSTRPHARTQHTPLL